MLYGKSSTEVQELVRTGKVTVAVIGAGKMGLPLSATIAAQGAKVIAVRPDQPAIDLINKGQSPVIEEPGLQELLQQVVSSGNLSASPDTEKATREADCIIILVPLLLTHDFHPDYSILQDVANKIGKGLRPSSLVIDETTLPPNGVSKILQPLLESNGLTAGRDFGLVYSPERLATGVVFRNLKRYPKIVSGIDQKSVDAAMGLYQCISNRVIPVSNIQTAELIKLAEGGYRDLNIAYSNLLAKLAARSGVDMWEVVSKGNIDTQDYCHLHRPGPGVGGHCIPVYPWFIIRAGEALNLDMTLIKSAREVNDTMYLEVLRIVESAMKSQNLSYADSTLGILGVTFRPDVKELRFTPSKLLSQTLLREKQATLQIHDPYYSVDELTQEGFPGAPLEKVLESDLIILHTFHQKYHEILPFLMENQGRIIDATASMDFEGAQWKIGKPLP